MLFSVKHIVLINLSSVEHPDPKENAKCGREQDEQLRALAFLFKKARNIESIDEPCVELTMPFARILWIGLWLLALTTSLVAGSSPKRVYHFDARYLQNLNLREPGNAELAWDSMHLVAALQGIVNRDKPQLYITFCAGFDKQTDQFWLDWLRQEDGWLKSTELAQVGSLEELVRIFAKDVKGLVVYDPEVPATACLASTAAGCERLLPVRFSLGTNSIYRLLTQRVGLPVVRWLVNPDGSSMFTGTGTIPDIHQPSSGSAKIDAYRWAVSQYVDSGKCDSRFAAHFIDAFWIKRPLQGPPDLHTLSNHDYFVARRAFFFDLSPWGDEAPNDDPGQKPGLERETLLLILKALNRQVPNSLIKVGGFTPWPYKYTSESGVPGLKHSGVPTEWEFARLISQFNGYMEADAAGLGGIANASFYAHYPLKKHYQQPNGKPTRNDWQTAGYLKDGKVAPKLYVAHYVGDYDSPSWLYKAVPAHFNDAQRGAVPLGWAFNPNLADRVPQVFAYAYRHATTNDFFISGDSGAGYLNPRALTVRPDSKLPSALPIWTEHCRRYFKQFDMSITGFVLDGDGGPSTELEFAAYKSFSPDGCGNFLDMKPQIIAGVPTMREWDMPWTAPETAAFIAGEARQVKDQPRFLWARSILQSPGWYAEVSRLLREKYPQAQVQVVDPYTFFGLVREYVAPRR